MKNYTITRLNKEEDSSTLAKVRRVEKLLKELGLTINSGYDGQLFIRDIDFPERNYLYFDLDENGNSHPLNDTIPTDYKSYIMYYTADEED